MSLTLNPVSSRSGSDNNMTLSSKDLLACQGKMWASCPDWVQTIILKNIHETIKAMMQRKHGVQEDHHDGFTDDWAVVGVEVQSQISSRAPTCATPRIQSQTPSNPDIGALAGAPGNGIDSQETVTSFDFSQTATRLLSFLDSDPQTPDGSQEVAVGLTLDNTVTPTTLRQLALSIGDLESP